MKFFKMDIIHKLHQNLDSITQYLTPLLPLANCHMVEFITQNHWGRLLPEDLTESLEKVDLNEATRMFWKSANDLNSGNGKLDKWISTCRSHYISANNEYCLTRAQFENRIRAWGGDVKPEIQINSFMSSKKSYEVQSMCGLIASLHELSNSTCCVEAGGGRGPLLTALSLAYHVPSLTVDCDSQAVMAAEERSKRMQKQWHAIAKCVDGTSQVSNSKDAGLHRFASAFVTKESDLTAFVRKCFPEYAGKDIRLLLTGLHTCGNLGPVSLRIFTSQASTSALFNVPCCYHLLTEDSDDGLFDVFQRNYGGDDVGTAGFPMSKYLRGMNLGRNARMLAAQSVDRVVNLEQIPARSLLYRAMLQVLIEKHLPNTKLSEGRLKRLSKCDSFNEYFKMADGVLKLDLFDKLSDSYLEDFLENMEVHWKKLVLFYLLRLCLAQVIEAVILLDRLLFLYENGFERAFLVKLFDPVLSPRCHSIVALR